MTVYLDLVMVLNFLVDFLLLLGTNRLSGFPLEVGRLLGAALLGSIYSGACMLHRFRFLGSLLWRVVFLVLMAVLAFGWNRGAWKRGGVFVLLSMALGGLAVSVGKSDFLTLILSALCIWALCNAAFGGQIGQREYVNVTLRYGGNTVSVVALRDTGNGLRDPVTGEPVLVVSGRIAKRLTGLSEEQIRNPLETMAKNPLPGLRLIPYASVGNGGGMLLALRVKGSTAGQKSKGILVAFAAEGIGEGQVYQALTGGMAF